MGWRGEQAGYRDCGFGDGLWRLFGVGVGFGGRRRGEDRAAGDGGVDCGRGAVEVGAWTGCVGCGGAEGKAWVRE